MKALVFDISPRRWFLCKAASFVAPGVCYGPLSGLRLVDHPVPELPGRQWVRLRTLLGGICGSDLALIMLRNHPATILQRFASFPAVLGHENVAIIEQVGADVSDWRAGDRVCVEPAIGCAARGDASPCRQCTEGRTSLCERSGGDGLPPRALVGLNRLTGGSWAERFVAHQSQLHRVPERLTDEAAVLIDPLASAAHAVLRRMPREGESILVNGAGIIGLGILAAIRAMGCANPISIVARHHFQQETARRLGASDVLAFRRKDSAADRYDTVARLTTGIRVPGRFGNQGLIGGFDLTFDCTGTARGMTDAIKWTRSRGTVVSVGTSGIGVVDTTPIWFDEIEIIGANGRQIETYQGRAIHTYELVLEWATSGRLDLSAIPVKRFPLSRYRAAFRQIGSRGRYPIIKAAFDPWA